MCVHVCACVHAFVCTCVCVCVCVNFLCKMVASDSDSNKVFGYIINQILCKRDLGLGTDSV